MCLNARNDQREGRKHPAKTLWVLLTLQALTRCYDVAEARALGAMMACGIMLSFVLAQGSHGIV